MKVGDRVYLLKSSPYYEQGLDMEGRPTFGVIIYEEEDDEYRWEIRWENGNSNDYRDEDLAPLIENNESYSFLLQNN